MRLTPGAVWQALRAQTVFLSGGTGFIGRWLVEALLQAQRDMGLGLQLVVLSRDPAGFLARHPHLHDPALQMLAGDITQGGFASSPCAYAIHAALPVSSAAGPALPDIARQGALQMVRHARQCGVQRLLHVSSGAVYGPGAGLAGPIAEDTPQDMASAANDYTVAKRAEEQVFSDGLPAQLVTARCFTFMGPGLSPATGTAAAQFVVQAARGEPVTVSGDGTPVRSYQYASDMARWLLLLLSQGQAGRAYNVGSDEAVSIAELAQRVHRQAGLPGGPVVAARPVAGRAGHLYVPCVARARDELGLGNAVGLDQAIRRSLQAARAGATNITAS